jgi:hypothetical protein
MDALTVAAEATKRSYLLCIGILKIYLDELVHAGSITQPTADALYERLRQYGFQEGLYQSDFGDDNRTQDINNTPERQKSNKDSREKYT